MNRPTWPENGAAMLTRMGSAFTVRNGELYLDNQSVTTLVRQIGTPCYLYSQDALQQRLAALREALPADIALHYAVKANPHEALLAFFKDHVDGFDTASLGELIRLADQGVDLGRCSLAGPAKSDEELAFALKHDVLVNLESVGEAQRLAKIAKTAGKKARVALRINPPFELKGSGMRMGGGAKPFGIDAEQIPAMAAELDDNWLRLEGFHLYAGSQCREAAVLVEGFDKGLALMAELAAAIGFSPKIINLGGGFGIAYSPLETPLDLAAVGKGLKELLALWRPRFANAQFVIELGRYLVGEAGIYVTRIMDRKYSRGKLFLICDGGMHHHLALSGNLGQVLRKNWPLVIANRMDAPCEEMANLAGPLCTPLDILGSDQPLPKTEPGDLVVVLQSGAYGASASPAGFLSRPAAVERMVSDKTADAWAQKSAQYPHRL